MTHKQVFDKIIPKEVKMKIEVNRSHASGGELMFTILVSEPHEIGISQDEIEIMHLLEKCVEDIKCYDASIPEEASEAVRETFHDVKSNIFHRLLDKLKFSIENNFRPKFKPICQEIYNWIYDYQKGEIKQWMQEF